ncbi:phage holin [Ornithinibacillus xuwenensis]|uniref:Phage holin n=1 Tax=Ornithinibacillus xuwenensis TaxID=3144668 RepID=A0ABU9XC65_9BACI
MDKGSLIRTVVLIVALINQFLVVFGKSPLPVENELIEQLISAGFTFVASIVAWFRNNYVTTKGDLQKKVLQSQGLLK